MMKKSNKGQASLIMILVIAMAFIFFAIELNWGRVAEWKLTTWMAATSASSQVASNFASYGERILWEQLLPSDPCHEKIHYNDGNIKCEQDSFGLWLDILVIIVVIVIVIVTWGSTSWLIPMVIATLVMMSVALVLEYCVIRPMMFAIWNKLQQNLTMSNQFQESGLSTGLQMLATDSATIPDRFDWDGNGRWGLTGTKPNDNTGRYALFYTERLKFVKPPDNSSFNAFKTSLDNLITQPYNTSTTEASGLGMDPYCTEDNPIAPQCDPQCTGVQARSKQSSQDNIGLGWRYNYYSTVTPSSQYVPMECFNACTGYTCPPVVDQRPLIYDPSLENPPAPAPVDPGDQSTSFRYRLGHDDEIGKSNNVAGLNFDTVNASIAGSTEPGYKSLNAKGVVFPMLYGLGLLDQGIAFGKVNGAANAGLSTIAQALNFKANTDTVSAFNTTYNFWDTNNNDCAQNVNSANGFFWKKGAERYCSTAETDSAYTPDLQALIAKGVKPPAGGWASVRHWPYSDCPYMHDGSGAPAACSSSNGNLWAQDRLDDFVAKLADLIKFNDYLKGLKEQSLVNGVQQWYIQAADFIAPQCTANACAVYTASCKEACNGDANCMNSCQCVPANYGSPTPVDAFVATDPSMKSVFPFADDPSACNTGRQGAMIQWVYDLNNWANKLSNGSTGWLDKTFGNAATDLCTGKLGGAGSIVECLQKNSKYDSQLNACKNTFPLPVTTGGVTTYPDMPAACVDVIRLEQQDLTAPLAFFTHFSNYASLVTTPGVTPTMPPPAPEDDTLLTTTPYKTNVNTYAIIQAWLGDNTLLKDEATQRYNALNTLYLNAAGAFKLFQEGKTNFTNFLQGPAVILMATQADQPDTPMKRLPSFAIYGWKDNKVYTNGGKQIGKWHVVRMEVKSKHQVPWIKSWQDVGFITTKTYYQFTDGNHDVLTRATRWDENKTGGLANFANGNPIWRFVWGNPHPGAYIAISWAGETGPNKTDVAAALALAKGNDPGTAIEQYCIGDTTTSNPWGRGIGLTKDTKEALQTVNLPNDPPMNSSSLPDSIERDLYGFKHNGVSGGGAFMINIDPRVKIPPPQQYIGSCKTAHPVTTYDALDETCGSATYFDSCCTQGTYGFGYGRWGYLAQYGETYCKQTNQARCAQNVKNKELQQIQKDELQCFSAVDYLLSTGVQSTSAARYGVPPKGTIGTVDGDYHTQVRFYTPQDAQDGKTEYGFDKQHTVVDTDIFK